MQNLKSKQIEGNIENIIKGLNRSANVIISTMGGYGQNVILASEDRLVFTKDGVSVADYLKLEDPIENIGSRLLIEAANKTVEQCGDGTTLTTLFSKELINMLIVRINNGEDVNQMLEDIDNFVSIVEEQLLAKSKKIETYDEIYKIAKTSCKSPVIGMLIKDIYLKTGYNAEISVEMSRTSNSTYHEIINGLSFESGMINSRFANQENGTCIFEYPQIVIEGDTVSSEEAYIDLFNSIKKEDGSVVIIAPSFSDTFIRFALTNKIKSGLKVCLVKAPGYGKGITENFIDIMSFSNNNVVDKIIITQFDFVMYNNTDPVKIERRVKQLKSLAESAVEEYDEIDYLNRITRLNQAGAIIYVGGITEKQAKEEFDRIEDAIGAVKSSLRNGYVRGAGCELFNLAEDLKHHPSNCSELLKTPLNQIFRNAKINKLNLEYKQPYNVINKSYDDSIIDPTIVLINSLKNSVSLIKLLINTSYIIYNN
jgi:chaperonin GroEL